MQPCEVVEYHFYEYRVPWAPGAEDQCVCVRAFVLLEVQLRACVMTPRALFQHSSLFARP